MQTTQQPLYLYDHRRAIRRRERERQELLKVFQQSLVHLPPAQHSDELAPQDSTRHNRVETLMRWCWSGFLGAAIVVQFWVLALIVRVFVR